MHKSFTSIMVFIYAITIASHSNAQFTTISNLAPLAARDFATKEKHQSKVFQMDGKYWAILANSTGTHLWSLNNNSWSFERQLVTKNSRADYVIIDNTVHILLYSGSSSQFVSIEYDRDKQQFKQWNRNKSTVDINLEKDVEVASIDVDKNGRLWIASNGDNGNVNVRWSEAPYTKWSAPITLERGVHADDICAVISLPMFNQIGVLWSNQKTKRWGFKTHTTGDETTRWSKDEVPASNSALSQGTGIADDHINIKVASDGTLYAAIKTGYDKIGYPLIALLVRRPSGVWDELYEVSQTGTLPIVLLNEEQNLLKVVYTSATYGGDILYKESSTKNISFCETHTLIKGNNTYASSIKGSYSSETVILASNENQVVGVLVSDDPTLRVPLTSDCLVEEKGVNFTAIPNPFMSETTVHFSLPESEPYTLTLYDVNGARISRIHNSAAVSGKINKYTIDASSLARGLYILKLETINKVRTLKLVHER